MSERELEQITLKLDGIAEIVRTLMDARSVVVFAQFIPDGATLGMAEARADENEEGRANLVQALCGLAQLIIGESAEIIMRAPNGHEFSDWNSDNV